MTELVVFFVKEFNISAERLSNDSTTIKAFGRYPEKTTTGLELKKGKSQDNRPEKHLKKVEQCLAVLNGKKNKLALKTIKTIEEAAQQIVEGNKLESTRNNAKRDILLLIKF